jgi:hypothetical protein
MSILDHKVTTPKCDTCLRWSRSEVECECSGDKLVSKWKRNCMQVVSEFLEMD